MEHLGRPHNLTLRILFLVILRRVPLTLTYPPHPALWSENQDPIRVLMRVSLLGNITVIVTWS